MWLVTTDRFGQETDSEWKNKKEAENRANTLREEGYTNTLAWFFDSKKYA